jgi:DHA2 family multidrug resistance protein
VPQATGLYNFLRITAGSFAASIATTAWDRLESMHQTRIAESMGALDPSFTGALEKLRGAGLSSLQAVGAVTNQVISQAYLLATVDIFRICSILMVLLVPAVWITRKALAGGGSHAAAD